MNETQTHEDPQVITPKEAAGAADPVRTEDVRTAARRVGADAPSPMPAREMRTRAKVMAGATATELIVAAAAVVLGVLGLAEVYPIYAAAVAAILVGCGLTLEGAGIVARYRKILAQEFGTVAGTTAAASTTVQSMAGIAGIVLGILALLGYLPTVLIAVSALVYGGALLFGAPEATELDAIADDNRYMSQQVAEATHRATQATAGASALAGMAVGVLGILVLAGTGSLELVLIAMIVAGGATLFRGGLFTLRATELVRQS